MPDVVNVAFVRTKWWCKIISAWRELVVIIINYGLAVEDAQQAVDEASVSLIRYPASVVAFSCKVRQSIPWWFLVIVYEDLYSKPINKIL